MRLIDADALINDVMDRYCKDCDKRKGIKSGKWKIIYEIGDVPCRACDVDNMINDLENAPTITPDMAQVLAYESGKAERKRGRWEMKPDPYGFFEEIPVCSECGCTTKMRETYKFCPNCGAEMSGGEDE